VVPFAVGDYLGLRLDSVAWTLELFVNGVPAGDIDVPPGTYVPVVGLRCPGDAVTLLPGLPLSRKEVDPG